MGHTARETEPSDSEELSSRHVVPEIVQIGPPCQETGVSLCKPLLSRSVLWLQAITVAWMLVECGVSAYAAWTSHSTAMLAFGSDSFVEVLSGRVAHI